MIRPALALFAGALLAASPPSVPGQTRPVAASRTAASAPAAAPAPAVAPSDLVKLSFDFANPALSPSTYRIEFDSTGLGHYHSETGTAGAPDAQGAMPDAFDQQIRISAPIRAQLLALGGSRHLNTGDCESRQHKVAFTGQKTFTYTGPVSQGSCTFNWSQDAQLMRAANTCMAISLTLEQGRRLRLAYLHDRLSLDAELETLAAAAKGGTALELQNIASELEEIASDSAVMKRAQMRAAALLATASAQPPASH